MPRYAAFLRAVNLGSTNKAGKETLKQAFEDCGLDDVATFRTSGNVVFSSGRRSEAALRKQVEHALVEALGFEVPVYLRSQKEVLAIATADPFDGAVGGKLQVILLAAKPSASVEKAVLALATDDDRLAFGERELFWLPRGGTMESELDQKAIGKLIGPATARTMGTISAIAEKYFGA